MNINNVLFERINIEFYKEVVEKNHVKSTRHEYLSIVLC